MFDTTTTFVNATLALSGRPPIKSLSSLGIPLGFAISGMGTVSRVIQIAKAYHVSKNIKAVRKDMLGEFLEKKLGIDERRAQLVAPLTPGILRAIPGEIERKLHQLYGLINAVGEEGVADQQFIQISQILDDIQDQLKKKFIVEGLGIVANTLTISALYLFCIGSLNSIPFLFLASSFFIRISSLIYQDLT